MKKVESILMLMKNFTMKMLAPWTTEDVENEESGPNPHSGTISIAECLFCPHHSLSFVKNVTHRTKPHSFFILYTENLSD